ncbi:MAG TPA: hypothetical protein VJS92_06425, partial [Candidatus Polarisedimenticolaceae bacterium]|nr:hypothetical protein [Candidatus Polarisedimenticolaceae bacterium]
MRIVSILLALGFALGSAAAATAALDVEAYVAELERLSKLVAEARMPALSEERDRLPAVWAIASEEMRWEVPTAALRAALTAVVEARGDAAPALATLQARLKAMQAEARALNATVEHDSQPARDKLTAILARAEYAGSADEGWFAALRRRVSDALEELLRRMFGGLRLGSGASGLGWIVVAAAGIALALAVVKLLRRPVAPLQ